MHVSLRPPRITNWNGIRRMWAVASVVSYPRRIPTTHTLAWMSLHAFCSDSWVSDPMEAKLGSMYGVPHGCMHVGCSTMEPRSQDYVCISYRSLPWLTPQCNSLLSYRKCSCCRKLYRDRAGGEPTKQLDKSSASYLKARDDKPYRDISAIRVGSYGLQLQR